MIKIKCPRPQSPEQASDICFISSNLPQSQALCLDCGYYRKPVRRAFCALTGEKISRMDLSCIFFTTEKIGGDDER